MNGRKREEERGKREESGERNTRRRRVSHHDAYLLPTLNNTILYSFYYHYFSTITSHFSSSLTRSSTSIYNTYITYNITNISCSLLCSSSITSCTFDLEHTTPFVSIVGVKPLQRQSVISCTSINDVTIHIIGLCILYSGSINKCFTLNLFLFIVIYFSYVDIIHRAYFEHLQESVAGLTSARCVEHLIEVRCSL